jgi:hypothetical protein
MLVQVVCTFPVASYYSTPRIDSAFIHSCLCQSLKVLKELIDIPVKYLNISINCLKVVNIVSITIPHLTNAVTYMYIYDLHKGL